MNLILKKTMMSACFLALLGVMIPFQAYAEESTVPAVRQERKIQGHVSDNTGEVIGASVIVKGDPTRGTITDIDGNFTIQAKTGEVLEISFVGYKTQEIVVGSKNDYKILLEEDSQALDEVVVVGYGVQKKKLVTGATVEVKGESITKLNTTQALGALQSQTPGVNIQAASGQPGDSYKVMIRGAGTNGDTTPLYVIDGVSGGDISNLNPADIERIDVLKDAASCAIYGSAAANGVILITTKQGKEGKVQVTYDGFIGWQNVYKMVETLNAQEYMAIMNQISINDGNGSIDWAQSFVGYEDLLASYQNGTNTGTDWLDALRNKNAVTTSHAINVTGGSDRSKFSMGAGYQYQDGIFGGQYAKSDYRRFTFRLNSDHVIYRSKEGLDVIKVGENMYFSHKQNQGINIEGQYWNSISDMIKGVPLVPIYNEDGDFFSYNELQSMGMQNGNGGWGNSYITNPLYCLVNSSSANNKSVNFNMSLVGYIEIQPIKGLTYRGQVNYSQSSYSYRSYSPVYQAGPNTLNTIDSATNQTGLGWGWGTTNTINYKFDIDTSHHFDVLVGTEYGESRPNNGFSLSVTATDGTYSDLYHAYMSLMNNANGSASASGTPYTDSRSMSYFGRINYDFNETYMFSAIIRADGSSVFAPGHRWGYFPSFSAGWVVTNEKFMKKTESWLDFLKIRAGWGQNGNCNISAFQYEAAYTTTSDDENYTYAFTDKSVTGTTGAALSRASNEDLTWETSEQVNVGLDARFLDNRLGITFDWYQKTTKDLLLEVPINAAATGFSTQLQNAGTVRNRGVEFAINWNDKIGKDFNYSIGYNIAYNQNKVTKINSDQKYFEGGGSSLLAQGTDAFVRFEEGYPIGYFYGYKTLGVIQNEAELQEYINYLGGSASNSLQGTDLQVGDLMFADTNGDGVITTDDKTNLGNPTPDVTMGINLSASWKGFDINITGYAALGQQMARNYRQFADSDYNNFTTEVFSYWTGEGTSNKYPRLGDFSGVNWTSISDIYIEDARYFRLQNLTIGYDFKTLFKKWQLQQLRLYVTVQNLFTITPYKGMDPENGRSLVSDDPWVTGVDLGNYPSARTFLVGVNLKF